MGSSTRNLPHETWHWNLEIPKYQTPSDCVRNLQLDAPLVMARLTDAKGAAGDSYAKLRKDVTLSIAWGKQYGKLR